VQNVLGPRGRVDRRVESYTLARDLTAAGRVALLVWSDARDGKVRASVLTR